MNNLTKRQRVLRARSITRAIAKEKKYRELCKEQDFATENPTPKLTKGLRTRNRVLRQIVLGTRACVLSEMLTQARQTVAHEQMRNAAVTEAWKKQVADQNTSTSLKLVVL